MKITVEVSPNFKEVFTKVDKKVLEAVKMGLVDTAYTIEGEAKQRAPVDTGILRAKIRAKKEDDLTWYIGTEVKYAKTIEEGGPPRLVPLEPLIHWVRRKQKIFQVSTMEDIIAVAKGVQKGIADKGTRKQPFLMPAWKKILPTIKERISRFLKR